VVRPALEFRDPSAGRTTAPLPWRMR